jgi:PAS domain S-box-containing protein
MAGAFFFRLSFVHYKVRDGGMQNPFETFAREYDDTGVAVYDYHLKFLESNQAFDSFFGSHCRESLSDLLGHIADGEEFLAQMMMSVEMNQGEGSCNIAYNSEGKRREFKVKLNALGSGDDRKYLCSFADVTEFLFFQKVLMHRADNLESLDRNSPVGVFKAAVGGGVLYVNNGLVFMLGYKNEHQLYNIRLSEVWANLSDRERLLELLNKYKTVNGFETRWRRKKGTLFWVSLTATSQHDKNGKVAYFEVVVIDVDQKKKAEEDLKRLQNKLHRLIDSKTTELKRANNLLLKEVAVRQKAESIYSVLHAIAEETVKTESLHSLLKFIHNQLSRVIHTPNLCFAFYHPSTDTYTFPYSVDIKDSDSSSARSESMKGSLTDYVRTTGQPLLSNDDIYEKMIADRRILSIENPSDQWMGVPLRGSEGIWGVLSVKSYAMKHVFSSTDLVLFSGLAESISMGIDRYRTNQNRKRMESLYNTVVNNLNQGVLMCDPSDRIVFANEAFSCISGIPAEQLKGVSLSTLLSSENTERTTAVELRSMGERSSYQLTLIRPDGAKVPVAVSSIPGFDEGGSFQGTIGLFETVEEVENLMN